MVLAGSGARGGGAPSLASAVCGLLNAHQRSLLASLHTSSQAGPLLGDAPAAASAAGAGSGGSAAGPLGAGAPFFAALGSHCLEVLQLAFDALVARRVQPDAVATFLTASSAVGLVLPFSGGAVCLLCLTACCPLVPLLAVLPLPPTPRSPRPTSTRCFDPPPAC